MIFLLSRRFDRGPFSGQETTSRGREAPTHRDFERGIDLDPPDAGQKNALHDRETESNAGPKSHAVCQR